MVHLFCSSSTPDGSAASAHTARSHRNTRKRRHTDMSSTSTSASHDDVFSFLNTTLTQTTPAVVTSASQLTSAVDAASTLRLRDPASHAHVRKPTPTSTSTSTPTSKPSRPASVIETGKQLLSCHDALRTLQHELTRARASVTRNRGTSMAPLFAKQLETVEARERQLRASIATLESSVTHKHAQKQSLKF